MRKVIILFTGLSFLSTKNQAQTVTDIDGNVYNTVTIGTQIWMKENLKVTKYQNGDLIGTTDPTLNIFDKSMPIYQWDNEGNVLSYGRLYTWFAVTDSRNVCPTSWHVPSDTEWGTLDDYLTNNGFGFQGSGVDIAKSIASTSGWDTSTTEGTVGNDQISNNSSGFTALPSGCHRPGGYYLFTGTNGMWWSSTADVSEEAFYYYISNDNANLVRTHDGQRTGYSVRCIKDNTTAINIVDVDEISIYPNPANEKIYFKNISFSNSIFEILNMDGKLLLLEQNGSNFMDISKLKTGLYIIKIEDSGVIKSFKFIKN